jgi:predicted negative regulator of RcsB-dependent stress response
MKDQNRYLLMTLVLACVTGVVSWQWYQSQQREQLLQQKLMDMQQQVSRLEEQTAHLRKELNQLNKTSFKSLVKDANNALLEGWQSLLNTVEGEIKKARDALNEPADDQPASANSSSSPASSWNEPAMSDESEEDIETEEDDGAEEYLLDDEAEEDQNRAQQREYL